MLADMGADVIKVEPPGGDPFRQGGAAAHTPGMGAIHMTLNRGKRSLVLDLKSAEGREVMRRLIPTAEIFIHNVRAKSIEGLGFGYEAVKSLKRDIVYAHARGFGAKGPYADRPAYDDVIQAASGILSLGTRMKGKSEPEYIFSPIADKVGALHAVYAVLAAYIHKLRTGEGQLVEIPMFEAFTHFLLEEHLYEKTFVPPIGDVGYARMLEAGRQPFPTADGYISIVPYSDQNWRDLFAILGCPELLPPKTTSILRLRHVGQFYKAITERTPARTTAEWVEILNTSSIPAMPVRDIGDLFEDPHLKAVGFFKERVHPEEGRYLEMQPPIVFGAASARDITPAPLIGQHNAEILAELGLQAEQQ
jgi:crotonobetainyl-CoA:carnitine CoA-transferase CaiB-like acyl-CoA transferase